MNTSRGAWPLAGVVAGAAGLATSYLLAALLTVRETPVVAVAELVIRYVPGDVAESAISILGRADKPVLVAGVVLVTVALFALAGVLARRSWAAACAVFVVLAVVGAVAVASQTQTTATDLMPVAVGLVTWLVALALLVEPLRAGPASPGAAEVSDDAPSRRSFLIRTGLLVGAAAVAGAVGRTMTRGRRRVEETRRLLKLNGVSMPVVPERARAGLAGISPWMTPAGEFYLIDTAIGLPAIEPATWELRIHGMVERELRISFDELISRRLTQSWVTLNCVSNEVGGDLIGNAWWSGVRVADLLAEAGVLPGADAVKQTSDDGWTCGTPLEALTDERDAMLAVAMNGKPLPIEHGFPVRTIVPGLYGYVSATKWLVDMEVTRFADFEAYWTTKGWGVLGPVKMSSRIDVPRGNAEVSAGEVAVGGVAWAQHTGIAAVEVAVDGGAWQPARISPPGTDDTWVQWAASVDLDPGEHTLRVRATDKDGLVQTAVERDVLPDGATGLHAVDVTAS